MKIITFDIKNTFVDYDFLKITMPYDPHKSMLGFYIKMQRKLKRVIATLEKVPMDKIIVKATLEKNKSFTKRMIFEFPWCGAKLDVPNDATGHDWQIIKAQLNVLSMSK